ncbi:MAG: hypothetical protein Q9N32_08470 [Gammaproteobacteria bacterium]|nr:hypothetical protein [Gammaproteobacteria bacterium]
MKTSLSLIVAGMMVLPSMVSANDLLTVTTVQYVKQQCIEKNKGKMNIYEATHKCSCVIDKLAEEFTQTEFEEADTSFQLRNMPGDRGGEFRDDKKSNHGIGRFQKVHAEAYKSCRIR